MPWHQKRDDCDHEETETVDVEVRCSTCKGESGWYVGDNWKSCTNPDCVGGEVTKTVEQCKECGYRFW